MGLGGNGTTSPGREASGGRSGLVIGGVDKSEKAGGTDADGDDKGVPYQPKVFQEFIGLIGRYFYDDGSIVLLDYLAAEQRGITETELKENLRWRENLLQQKLYMLEKQLLLERIVEAEKGSKSLHLWRIHSRVFIAVEWRLNSLIEQLSNELKQTNAVVGLLCPSCDIKVDLLEAAAGPKAPEDDHPLCHRCGARLTTSSFEESRAKAADKLKRAETQLSHLRESLSRVRAMNVPVFTSKAHAGMEPDAAGSTTNAGDTAAPSGSGTERAGGSDRPGQHDRTQAGQSGSLVANGGDSGLASGVGSSVGSGVGTDVGNREIAWFSNRLSTTAPLAAAKRPTPSAAVSFGTRGPTFSPSLLEPSLTSQSPLSSRAPTPAPSASVVAASAAITVGNISDLPGAKAGSALSSASNASKVSPLPRAPLKLTFNARSNPGNATALSFSGVKQGGSKVGVAKPFSLSMGASDSGPSAQTGGSTLGARQAANANAEKRRAPPSLAQAFEKRVKF